MTARLYGWAIGITFGVLVALAGMNVLEVHHESTRAVMLFIGILTGLLVGDVLGELRAQ